MPGAAETIAMPDRSVAHRVTQQVREALRAGLVAGREAVVVGVSGGPDSMALLHVLRRLAPEFRLRLHVVHVDHGLHRRAAAHAAFVRRMARAWGLPVSVVRVDVRARAQRDRLTLEEAARTLRYAALARVARRVGARRLAVAHTADDQVETALLRLLRGAADPLAGMPAQRRHDGLWVVRPLLEIWRGEVLAYLKAEGVPWRRDPTNRLRTALRNRIRQDLLPVLQGYNPGVKAVVRRLAVQAADDALLLETLAAEAARGVLRRRRSRVTIDAAALCALPAALQRRVIYQALRSARGNIRGLAFVHVERVRRMARAGRPGERADLPGLVAERTARDVTVRRVHRRHRRTGT
ncbi:MAG: tRNA lysidine(34) synthetase TilS [Armatimonadota bacterium]|nr:tRNA lysidine(34) synthetase TilS [Armatimonadota bacterium]